MCHFDLWSGEEKGSCICTETGNIIDETFREGAERENIGEFEHLDMGEGFDRSTEREVIESKG